MSLEGAEQGPLQLARADPGDAERPGTLASSPGDKKRAAKFMQEHLLPDTQAAGRMGEGGGKVVPPLLGPEVQGKGVLKPDTGLEGLSGWALESAMSDAMSVWQGQVARLMGRLQEELKALGGTNKLFKGQDLAEGRSIASAQGDSTGEGKYPLRSGLDQY
ncbi:hypothetical protein [Streptomyces qinglanensis]|uniref:hypothetical protein n=1 Tax=Streptomyces qinglanensis TaxID=943816 RepID=UPI003D71C560